MKFASVDVDVDEDEDKRTNSKRTKKKQMENYEGEQRVAADNVSTAEKLNKMNDV